MAVEVCDFLKFMIVMFIVLYPMFLIIFCGPKNNTMSMYFILKIYGQMKSLHWEISDFLHRTEKSILIEDEPVKTGIQRQIIEMKDLLKMERNEYEVMKLVFSRLTCIYQGYNYLC